MRCLMTVGDGGPGQIMLQWYVVLETSRRAKHLTVKWVHEGVARNRGGGTAGGW